VWLARHGTSITLFEAGREPGGRARLLSSGDGEIDNGQHILLGAYTQTLELMETVSPGSTRRHFLRLPLTLDVPGHFHLDLPTLPTPLNLALGLLFTQGLSLKEKWAVARLMQRIKLLEPHGPSKLNVEQLLAGQPSAAIDYLWAPLCLSALNTPLHKASAQVFANVLRDALTGPRAYSDMLLPRTNLSILFPVPAVSDIQQHGGKVLLGTRISKIVPASHGVSLESPGQTWNFDQVILACAPQHAAQLLAPLPELQATCHALVAFQFQPIVTAYLDYPDTVSLPFPLIGLADEAAHFAFDQGYTHGRAGRLAVVTSAEHPAPPGGRSGRIRHIHQTLQSVLGPLPEPTTWRIIEEKRGTFECDADLGRPGHATEHPRVYLAGDYTLGPYPATLEGAVRSGVQCAKMLRGARHEA
jgi:squalene-associated FAD-dependent desaturase